MSVCKIQAKWEKKGSVLFLWLGDNMYGNIHLQSVDGKKEQYDYYYLGASLNNTHVRPWSAMKDIKESANRHVRGLHPDLSIDWPSDPLEFNDYKEK